MEMEYIQICADDGVTFIAMFQRDVFIISAIYGVFWAKNLFK